MGPAREGGVFERSEEKDEGNAARRSRRLLRGDGHFSATWYWWQKRLV